MRWGRCNGHYQADLPDFHRADTVGNGDVFQAELAAQLLTNFLQLLVGHLFIGFVFQMHHPFALGKVAGRAQKGDHRAVGVLAHPIGDFLGFKGW